MYTTTGRPWDGSKYLQMMLRPCNTAKVGKLPRGTTKIREIIDKLPDAQWEKILDRETYLALAYKLTDPDRRMSATGAELRDQGVEAALAGDFAAHRMHREDVEAVLDRLAATGRPFTADDVRAQLPDDNACLPRCCPR